MADVKTTMLSDGNEGMVNASSLVRPRNGLTACIGIGVKGYTTVAAPVEGSFGEAD